VILAFGPLTYNPDLWWQDPLMGGEPVIGVKILASEIVKTGRLQAAELNKVSGDGTAAVWIDPQDRLCPSWIQAV
jgi:hypothetical protein